MAEYSPEFMQTVGAVSNRVAESESALAAFWLRDNHRTLVHCMVYGECPKSHRVGLDGENVDTIGHLLLESGRDARDWRAIMNFLTLDGNIIELDITEGTKRVLLPSEVAFLTDKISN